MRGAARLREAVSGKVWEQPMSTLAPGLARRVALVAALLLVSPGAVACGEEAGPAPAGGGEHNHADVAFAHLMTHHHEHGVEMAKLAEQRGSAPQVKELGARIASAQEREIAQLEGFVQQFGAVGQAPVPPAIMKAVEEKQLADLEAAAGKEFDHLFLESMTHHHLSAIEMAEYELLSGAFPPARHLAQSMKDLQVKETEEMHKLLEELG